MKYRNILIASAAALALFASPMAFAKNKGSPADKSLHSFEKALDKTDSRIAKAQAKLDALAARDQTNAKVLKKEAQTQANLSGLEAVATALQAAIDSLLGP